MLEYKVTGKSVFKDQANRSEKWLKDYINQLNRLIQRDAAYIDQFVKTYERTNPDLVKYRKEIDHARTKGPELQDIYEGEKRAQQELPLDEEMFYTKAAVVGGVLAIGAVLSFL
jgi:predicted  nucleic acid-binding Zn-ribbon protein